MAVSEQENVGTTQLNLQWARILGRLQVEVGDVEYRTWLRQITLAGIDGDEVSVTLPTRFLRDWIRRTYNDRLNALWQAENPTVRRVDIRVNANPGSPAVPVDPVAPASVPAVATTPVRQEDRFEQKPEFSAALDPRFTFDGFVVGRPNEFAQPDAAIEE